MKTRITRWEHITVVALQTEAKEVFKWLNDGNWWVLRTGPYTNSKMFPLVDPDRLLVKAQRKIR